MAYSGYTFSITAGNEINAPLQFAPVAVIINNYTPYYIYLPDGLTFCPPFTAGVVIPLAHATQARATWLQSPFGNQIVTAIPGVTYTANLTFTEDPNQALSGGTPVVPPLDTRSAVYSAAPGATLTTGALPFTAFGARVDNYTGTWYQIGTTGILVPPFTTGFTLDLLPPVTSLVLTPATPPYGTNQNTGTLVVLTVYPIAIGNSSGTTNIPLSINSYVALGGIFPENTNIFTWDALAVGAVGKLKSITFHSPSVAQKYTISRLASIAAGGDIVTPTPLGVSGALLPGIIRVPPRGTVTLGTQVGPGALTSTIALVIPPATQVGDLLLLIVCSNGNNDSNPTGGLGTFVQQQKNTGDTTITTWLYTRAAILGDAGSTVTLTYAAPTRVRYGLIVAVNPYSGAAIQTAKTVATNTPITVTPATANGIWLGIFSMPTASTSATPSSTPANSDIREVKDTSAATGSFYIESLLYNGVGAIAPNAITTGVTFNNNMTIAIPMTQLTGTIGATIFITATIATGVDTTVDLTLPGNLGSPIVLGSGATGGIIISAPAPVVSNPTFDLAMTDG